MWQTLSNVNAPSPRDRHVATVFENALYIFGGFDGVARVSDLHSYNMETNEWASVDVAPGTAPSPRHSHAAVVYREVRM
jgi:N-acetylneuraminic acid mutarotase